MPAAAVIPASLVFTNVVAVKKLVVELLRGAPGPAALPLSAGALLAFVVGLARGGVKTLARFGYPLL